MSAIGLVPGPYLTSLSTGPLQWFGPSLRKPVVMNEIETLMRQAASLGSSGAQARKRGEEAAAENYYRDAFHLATEAINRTAIGVELPTRLEILRTAATLALAGGEVAGARRLIEEASDVDPSATFSDEWMQLRDVADWPDEWLIAAVRHDPPDVPALDVLADRYWKPLFSRCQMLTLNQEKASDLAQQAWCRVLRARNTLKPGGNFPAYLTTIATNLWRDSHRSARRAGPMAEHRMASLDAAFPTEDGETAMLGDMLPDLNALQADEQKLLALDIDQALGQLTPLLRDILVSRLINGDSCAEIGRRYDRTEQTVSAWVRQGIQEMKRHLEESHRAITGESKS